MNSTPTHITPEQVRELLRLKPDLWEGRELRVGDFVEIEKNNEKRIAVIGNTAHAMFHNENRVYLAGDHVIGWYGTADCLLLASESDLMDALERLIPNKHNAVNWEPYRLRYVIYDGKKEYIVNWGFRDYAYANTRLDALLNAVCALLEAREAS